MPNDKKEGSIIGQIAVGIIVALIAGGTSPWWVDRLFPKLNSDPPKNPASSSPAENSIQSAPTDQATIKFQCKSVAVSEGNTYTTIAEKSGEEIPVIYWKSKYFLKAGYDPLKRCQIVTERFQKFYNQGVLNFVKNDVLNGYPILCTKNNLNEKCEDQDLLITLQKDDNPPDVLKELINVNRNPHSFVLKRGGYYVDIKELLNSESGNNSENEKKVPNRGSKNSPRSIW